MSEADCVFCKIAKGEIKTEIICENENFFSIYDLNPKAEGHCLVISKRHFRNIIDLPSSLAPECLDCIKKAAFKVLEKTGAGGFNIISNNFGVAGQKVNHIHFHLLPRKEGDGLHMIV